MPKVEIDASLQSLTNRICVGTFKGSIAKWGLSAGSSAVHKNPPLPPLKVLQSQKEKVRHRGGGVGESICTRDRTVMIF